MLNNLTNFFNIITGRMIMKTPERNDLIALGTRDPRYGGGYKPTGITVEDFINSIPIPTSGVQSVTGLNTDNTYPLNPIVQISVDGVTVTGLGTPASPLASVGNPIVGSLVGGGILVGIWEENGVKKGLIASLTNLANNVPWTIPAFQSTLIGATAQNFYEGSTNTLAIIAQTGLPASTSYAAGVAKLHLGGGYNDWYLPSPWELTMCYANAAIVNRILGVNGFIKTGYHASAESSAASSWWLWFLNGNALASSKDSLTYVRAVRIHTF